MIHLGDLFNVLPTLDAESIDACVTDPPYGIGFMGKEWDTFAPDNVKRAAEMKQRKNPDDLANLQNVYGRKRSPAMSPSQIEYNRSLEGQRGFQDWTEKWAREVFRVLKPGGYVLVCGAPRSFHRMTSGLEDAGFEIRDCLSWLYGQGFPKSLNIGNGQGTALKPGWEPIVLARKPMKLGVAANVSTHGTGALNISACRLGDHDPGCGYCLYGPPAKCTCDGEGVGRWPANVLLDEDAAALLDQQTGELASGSIDFARSTDSSSRNVYGGFPNGHKRTGAYDANSGGASRFYYVAKPSREERDMGCHDLKPKTGGEATDRQDGSAGVNNPRAGAGRTGGARNFHPTVKPVELMRWLVKLVTPPGGTVLDPFGGSGTTAMACRYEQRQFVIIEREAEYVEIIKRRVAAVAPLFGEASA